MGVTIRSSNMFKILVLLIFVFNFAQATKDMESPAEDRFFLGLCCNDVRAKCVVACAARDCTSSCSGVCGFFATRCGPWTCSSLTTTCTAAATTAAPTTAAATTAAPTTVAATTMLLLLQLLVVETSLLDT